MSVPETVAQLGFLLLTVVPGVVFTAVRRTLRGPTPEDQDFSVRLINAISASIVFACVYLIALGPDLVSWAQRFAPSEDPESRSEDWTLIDALQTVIEDDSRSFGALVLTLTIVVPAVCGILAHLRLPRKLQRLYEWAQAKIVPVLRVRVSSAPSAWDDAAPRQADCLVRIYTEDERWVGGYLPSDRGYIATYPHPRDIFIPEQWVMDEDGQFIEPVEGSLGVYVPLSGKERVEWLQPRNDAPDDDPHVGPDLPSFAVVIAAAALSAPVLTAAALRVAARQRRRGSRS